jgi:rSAM/selenodomain-associated transferase 1
MLDGRTTMRTAPNVRPTIGVMAKAPVAGRCKTRLFGALDPSRASLLYRAMLLDTLDALARLRDVRKVVLAAPEEDGAAVLRSIVPPEWDVMAQRGADLGERLANGCDDLGVAARPVMLVSSDSPTIPVDALDTAIDSFVQKRRALIGPCDDGGYYLIGLTAREPRLFREITWSTSLVLEQTRERCRELDLPWDELATSYDVDTPDDVERLRAELSTEPDRAPRCAAFLRSWR